MTTPSVVVFDLGKVLLDFDYGIAAEKIASHSNLSAIELRKLIDHSPLLFRFETGLMTNEQFFSEVCTATGYRGLPEDFRREFSDIFWEIDPMIQWQAALRAKKIPTFIFSNTNEFAVTHIRQRFPFFHNFDGYVLSYEHRSMKPEAKIYEVVEKMTGRRGQDILYLDDRAENVAAGAARGWRALVHESPEKTLHKVQQLGLPLE